MKSSTERMLQMGKFSGIVLAGALVQSGLAWGGSDVLARRAYERSEGEAFIHTFACAAEFMPASKRFDHPEGRGTYVFVMPYADDGRAQFVKADFSGGKFVKGELHVFGRKPVKLNERQFAKLRETWSMLAAKVAHDDADRLTCFVPSDRAMAPRPCAAHPRSLSFFADTFGPLDEIATRLDVSRAKLRYRVDLRTAKGLSIELGVVQAQGSVSEKTVLEKVRAAVETRKPARKGRVSDRDIVDFRARCEHVLTPVGE